MCRFFFLYAKRIPLRTSHYYPRLCGHFPFLVAARAGLCASPYGAIFKIGTSEFTPGSSGGSNVSGRGRAKSG